MNIEVSQVVFDTGVNCDELTDYQRDVIVDALLDISGVNDVQFYGTFVLTYDVSSRAADFMYELQAVIEKIKSVFGRCIF